MLIYRFNLVNYNKLLLSLKLITRIILVIPWSIPKSFYRNASAVLLAYDITNKLSFSKLESWVNDIEKSVQPNTTIFLVGTKWDLVDKREVNYEEGEKFAEEYNLKFYETSALDDIQQYTLYS